MLSEQLLSEQLISVLETITRGKWGKRESDSNLAPTFLTDSIAAHTHIHWARGLKDT